MTSPLRGTAGGQGDLLPAAVLWDMDGLLVDSEPLWTVAERELYATWGRSWDDTVKTACMGRRLDTAVPIMIEYAGVSADPRDVADFLLQRMVGLFSASIPLRPGAARLHAALAERGVPQALVSSSYRILVDAVAATTGPWAWTLAGDEVGCAKPHPEPYLTAAAHLGVEPSACVVLEDSVAGASSGAAAGCRVVLVPSLGTVGTDPRWTRVPSLLDLDPTTLAARGG